MKRMSVTALSIVWALGCLGAYGAEEVAKQPEAPSCFQPRDTWWETMLASREALAEEEAAAERRVEADRLADPVLKVFQPLRAQLTSQQEPRKIKVPIAGVKQLYLGCSGQGRAFLGEPQLIGRDGKAVPLPLAEARGPTRHGWFAHSGKRNRWKPIVWGKQKYDTGLTIENWEICIELDGQAEWLEGWLGAQPERGDRQVEFWVQCRSLAEVKARAIAARQALEFAVAAAFPSPVDSRQQQLEMSSGIWKADWKRGDLADLAARYAAACGAKQKQAAEGIAKRCKSFAELKAVRDLFYSQYIEKRLALARKTLKMVERAAKRPQLTAELAAMEKQFADPQEDSQGEEFYVRLCNLRRKIILAHPALNFPKLLINKRSGFLPEHMCDQYLGRHSRKAPGLVVLEDWKQNPRETVLLAGKLPPGGTIHPDLSYDAKRVLFAFADHSIQHDDDRPMTKRDYWRTSSEYSGARRRAYFIYEYSFETGKVRQVTGTAADPMVCAKGRRTVLIEDTDPCYLPDGGMAFISTRCQQFGRCHGLRYAPSYTLHRGELDGTRIRPLSFNEANEWGPAVLSDGSLVYARWDYINRNLGIFHGLGSMRPDGTQTAHYYGNNSPRPYLIGEAQPIPGTHKTVATAGPHHGQTLGTLIVIDPRKGRDHGAPLTSITPELSGREVNVPRGAARTTMPLSDDLHFRRRSDRRAGTPWPVSEELFLCTYKHGRRYAIYLIDILGGRELIYSDANISCFDPIPLRPRPMPPALPPYIARGKSDKTGVFYIQNVYKCSQPLEPGSIKRMRINELISQPTAKPDALNYPVEIVKRILGTVPVRADGSVAFEAPARTAFQFQLLDEKGMAVMTMRSLVYLQPGERASCVGCHEPPNTASPPMGLSKVKVDQITPPAGPRYEGGFSFMRTVQPVLDRYCISCHGLDKEQKNVNLLGPEWGKRSSRKPSYRSLIASGRVKFVGEAIKPSRPKDFFAHGGTLAKMLLDGHPDKKGKKRLELDRESFQRIVDWLDVNAQIYGDYSHNRIEKQRSRFEGVKRLREAIAKRFGKKLASQPYTALVNVANPSESRVLMAPLPAAAGGWGQIAKGAFSGKIDPGWQEMRKLVEGSISPPKYRDIDGACGRDGACVCGCCWVRKDPAVRRQTTKPPPPSVKMISAGTGPTDGTSRAIPSTWSGTSYISPDRSCSHTTASSFSICPCWTTPSSRPL